MKKSDYNMIREISYLQNQNIYRLVDQDKNVDSGIALEVFSIQILQAVHNYMACEKYRKKHISKETITLDP